MLILTLNEDHWLYFKLPGGGRIGVKLEHIKTVRRGAKVVLDLPDDVEVVRDNAGAKEAKHGRT